VQSRCAGLLLCLVLGTASDARGQDTLRVSVSLRNVPVAVALDRLVAASGASLAYQSDVVGTRRVSCPDVPAVFEQVLRCIVRAAGLDFLRLSSGTYVVVASRADAPMPGALAGLIVDATSGAPVPAARVVLLESGETRQVGSDGLFSFGSLAPGTYRVATNAIGYAPVLRTLTVAPDGRTRERLTLERAPYAMAPIVVNGLDSRALRITSGNELLADSLAAVALPPGALLDGASGVLGVARRASLGDLHIQGGEAGEHLYRLDGAPVFEPFSLGRLNGAFSPLAINRLTVRKAGFGAPFGSFISGVVDVEQTLGGVGNRAELTTVIDPLSANGRLTVPLRFGTERGSAMLAARRGLWGLYRAPSIETTLRQWNVVDPLLLGRLLGTADSLAARPLAAPQEQTTDISVTDVHAALRVPLGAFSTFAASGWYGSNRLATGLFGFEATPEDPRVRVGLSRDAYRWQSLTAQARLERLAGARMVQTLRARVSRHRLSHAYTSLTAVEEGEPTPADLPRYEQLLQAAQAAFPAPDEGNRITEVALEGALKVTASSSLSLELGSEVAHTSSDLSVDNGVFRPIEIAAAATRGAVYGQAQWRPGEAWRLELGTRATWLLDRAAIYAEPRVALEHFTALRSGGSITTRLSGGVYRQFVTQLDVPTVGPSSAVPALRIWLPADATIAPPLARHVASEIVAALPHGWALRAEAYAKWQPVINAIDYSVLLDRGPDPATIELADEFVRTARGAAYGAGARVTKDAGWLRAEASYDVSEARRRFPARFGGAEQPVPWNEPHRAQLAIDVRAGASFSASVRARGVWGRTWALRQAYYDLLAPGALGAGLPIGLPGDDRLPALLETDVGATWRVRVGGTRLEIGAALLNAFNRQNIADYWLRRSELPTGSRVATRIARPLLGRQPMITVRAIW